MSEAAAGSICHFIILCFMLTFIIVKSPSKLIRHDPYSVCLSCRQTDNDTCDACDARDARECTLIFNGGMGHS